jgi:hypothetical protein
MQTARMSAAHLCTLRCARGGELSLTKQLREALADIRALSAEDQDRAARVLHAFLDQRGECDFL